MKQSFKLVHVGMNLENEQEARHTAETLALLFGVEIRQGIKSIFAGSFFECMKAPFLGKNGHIAMDCADLTAAMKELQEKGFSFRQETLALDDAGNPKNVYLDGEFGGFAIHVLQR